MQSGVKQLKAWIKRSEFKTNRQVAEYLNIPGLDDVVLNKVLNAGRRPELEKLVIIEEKTGIPIRSWVPSDLDGAEATVTATAKKRR